MTKMYTNVTFVPVTENNPSSEMFQISQTKKKACHHNNAMITLGRIDTAIEQIASSKLTPEEKIKQCSNLVAATTVIKTSFDKKCKSLWVRICLFFSKIFNGNHAAKRIESKRKEIDSIIKEISETFKTISTKENVLKEITEFDQTKLKKTYTTDPREATLLKQNIARQAANVALGKQNKAAEECTLPKASDKEDPAREASKATAKTREKQDETYLENFKNVISDIVKPMSSLWGEEELRKAQEIRLNKCEKVTSRYKEENSKQYSADMEREALAEKAEEERKKPLNQKPLKNGKEKATELSKEEEDFFFESLFDVKEKDEIDPKSPAQKANKEPIGNINEQIETLQHDINEILKKDKVNQKDMKNFFHKLGEIRTDILQKTSFDEESDEGGEIPSFKIEEIPDVGDSFSSSSSSHSST